MADKESRPYERLWSVLQALALLCAGVFPMLVNLFMHHPEERIVSRSPATPIPRDTITSRVISLPEPGDKVGSAGLQYNSESRQLRFERSGHQRSLRALASLPEKDTGWHLEAITQKGAHDKWQELSLLKGEQEQAIGSSFIELFEGTNEFMVRFGNAKGEKFSYPVRVQCFSSRD